MISFRQSAKKILSSSSDTNDKSMRGMKDGRDEKRKLKKTETKSYYTYSMAQCNISIEVFFFFSQTLWMTSNSSTILNSSLVNYSLHTLIFDDIYSQHNVNAMRYVGSHWKEIE